MNYRIRNTKKVSYTFMNAANIQDDSEGYFIFLNGEKISFRHKKLLLKYLENQTDEILKLIIKQNRNEKSSN